MKSPCFTTVMPGSFSAADVSADTNVAPCAGGCSTRACSAPGGTMSPAYLALPVTFSIASRRTAVLPTTVNDAAGSSAGLPSRRRSIFRPSVSCA